MVGKFMISLYILLSLPCKLKHGEIKEHIIGR